MYVITRIVINAATTGGEYDNIDVFIIHDTSFLSSRDACAVGALAPYSHDAPLASGSEKQAGLTKFMYFAG